MHWENYFRVMSSSEHPLLPFAINQEMAMEENAAVILKVRTRDRLAPIMLGMVGHDTQNDVLAVERDREGSRRVS